MPATGATAPQTTPTVVPARAADAARTTTALWAPPVR
ncbi:hypothetical protein M2161_008327 [Streptomyces sp. SAI-133]|nr:hypothetical protein [Streptomyces sp. SAI-133]